MDGHERYDLVLGSDFHLVVHLVHYRDYIVRIVFLVASIVLRVELNRRIRNNIRYDIRLMYSMSISDCN